MTDLLNAVGLGLLAMLPLTTVALFLALSKA